jgi:hypothetical protein
MAMSIGLAIIMLFGFSAVVGADSIVDKYDSPEVIIAKLYSEKFGVTYDEAEFRLELQTSFPDLEPALEKNDPNTFGGVWIQHEPEYKIIVAFTDECEKKIKKYDDYIPKEVSPYIETKLVERSLLDLRGDQSQMVDSFREVGIKTDSWVDVIENRVVVYIEKDQKSFLDNAINTGIIKMPSKVKIAEVEELTHPTTDIYGGLTLDSIPYIWHACTSGFAVEDNSSNDVGIITAGHCTDSLYYSPYSLTHEDEEYWGNYDVQWHTVSQYLTVTPEIQINEYGSTQTIYGQINRGSQTIGSFFGKYGFVTHFTCGQLQSKTWCPSDSVPNAQPTWMLVNNYFDYDDLVALGDSGGPWFNNGYALGITHGAGTDDYGNQYAVYMAIDYISGVGVSLMTD